MRNPSPVLLGAFRMHWLKLEKDDVYSKRSAWTRPL